MTRSTQLIRELAGRSPAMQRLRRRIERVAKTSVSVLLTGETGTGKSTAARLLHNLSQRGQGPLVKVNCSGIPETLFESELFGHEKGAFTGAMARREGLIPRAHGGSLLLDEIGDLSLSGQAKLLTALDDGEVRLVGGDTPLHVDVRLLSATSRDLDRAMRHGEFRADLFHRIAVVRLHVPSLRDREGDLPLLARGYLRRLAARHHLPVPGLDSEALAFLEARPWPGNVRELAHLLEAALVLSEGGGTLGVRELRDAVPERGGDGGPPPEPDPDPDPVTAPLPRAPRGRLGTAMDPREEKERIRTALERCRGNRTQAARLLGMSRNTLRARIRRYFEASPPSGPSSSDGRATPSG